MKRTKIAAIIVSAIFVLWLAAPIVTSTTNNLSPGILMAAYNYGTQSEKPIQSKVLGLVNMTILFHSDLHSELLPWPLADYKSGINNDPTLGGMARIATLIGGIKIQKGGIGESVLTFMDGDFLMGTPFSWLGTVPGGASPELVLMKMLGYDAIALGNHEFDYSDYGLSLILNNTNTTLVGMGQTMPLILCSNLAPKSTDTYNLGAFIKNNATIIVNGVTIGLFSVIGYGARATMFFTGNYNILDPIATAMAEVAYFKSQGVNLIIMLSHCGWKEDEALVSQVDGIDLICSGHDHSLLTTPIVITTPSGNTTIVDAKALGEYLGELEITVNATGTPGQGIGIRNYVPIHVNDSIAEDLTVSGTLSSMFIPGINAILAGYGLPYTYNQVIANTTFSITSSSGETAIGDLIADSLRWQFTNSTGGSVDFAFVPDGVIRHGFSPTSGNITFYDAVSVVPLGAIPFGGGTAMGLPDMGWLLCNFSLTGSEVKKALEFTLFAGGDYFLQVSGLRLTYDRFRPPGDQIISIEQNIDGSFIPLNNTKLYQVAINLEGALLISQIGIVVPKWPNGTALPADQTKYLQSVLVIDIPNLLGKPVPEWLCLVNYLHQMPNGTVDASYSATQGRITISFLNPVPALLIELSLSNLQTSSNLMFAGILGIVLILFAVGVAVAARRP